MRVREAVPATKLGPSANHVMVLLSPLKKLEAAESTHLPVRMKKLAELMVIEGVRRLHTVT